MAIAATNLAAAHDTANRTSTAYTTASISFVAGRTYMLAVRARVSSGTPAVGSITGGGNTWTLVETVNVSNITLWLYYCVAVSTTSGAISITPDGVTTWTQGGWIVDEFSGAIPRPIAQSAQNSETGSHSSLAVTLATFDDATDNAAYGVFAHNEDTALTAGSGFADLGASAESSENANRIKSIWKTGQDTSVDITSATTSSDVFGIAVEIIEGLSLTLQVGGTADDGRWYSVNFSNGGSSIWLGLVAGTGVVSFVRFTGVTVPPGSTIKTAYLTFTAAASLSTTPVDVNLLAVDEDNSSTISSTADGLARAQTTAVVGWNGITAWTTGGKYDSPDISAVIQEVIDRGGWADGNAICLFAVTTSGGSAYRLPYDYTGSASGAAKLTIGYVEPDPPSGSGAVTLQALVASGTGAMPMEGAGAAILRPVTASGVGSGGGALGSGAVSLQPATASGSGAMVPSGAGAVSLRPATAAGVGSQIFTGDGAASLRPLVVAGLGDMAPEGVGAATLRALVAAGTGSQLYTGAGAATLRAMLASGSGLMVPSGTGAAVLQALTASGAGTMGSIEGAGAVTLAVFEASGSGLMVPSGTGAVTMATLVAAGLGSQIRTGAGVVSLATLVAAGVGSQLFTGEGAVALRPLVAAGSAFLVPSGAGAVVLQVIQAAGVGSLPPVADVFLDAIWQPVVALDAAWGVVVWLDGRWQPVVALEAAWWPAIERAARWGPTVQLDARWD